MNIKSLLEKFRRGEATSGELKMLYNMLKEEHNLEILSVIDQEWTAAADDGKAMRPGSLLDKIHEKAGISVENKERTRQVIIFRRVMQYAAIFIAAFVLSWILKPSFTSQLADDTVERVNHFRIKVPYGSKSTIELPDSTKVILNSGSIFEYPDHFGVSDRTVYLNGEAYFDVSHNKKKPFYVKTSDAVIKVLGTQFNVRSYPGENIMETTLVSGSVEILPNETAYNKKRQAYKRILLRPNEKAVFMHDDFNIIQKGTDHPAESKILTATIASQETEKTQTDIAWKNDILILNNEPFREIVKKLERWYNVQIAFNDAALGSVRFSARFSGESIADVLHALSLTQPFIYEINKNNIKILTVKN